LELFQWCDTNLYRFVLQLISLAGLHSNATVTTELSRAFKDEGMLAYVRLIQAREKEMGVDVLTHQKWSGAPYMDGILGAIQSGSSSSKSMGEGNTEKGKSSERFGYADADSVIKVFKHSRIDELRTKCISFDTQVL
jgi:isocitrate lyase